MGGEIGTGRLHDIVHGPATQLEHEAELALLAQQQLADNMNAYDIARERGDIRAIEDAEARLTGLLEAHPELRDNLTSED